MAARNEREISDLVGREIERIADRRVVEKMRPLLVAPYAVERLWDYGLPDQRFTCWTVLEHAESNTGIAFCGSFRSFRTLGIGFSVRAAHEYRYGLFLVRIAGGCIPELHGVAEANPKGYEVQ
jgi:hypothetical protein